VAALRRIDNQNALSASIFQFSTDELELDFFKLLFQDVTCNQLFAVQWIICPMLSS
jgi:hypothetical protein